jgi:hypothetical protein
VVLEGEAGAGQGVQQETLHPQGETGQDETLDAGDSKDLCRNLDFTLYLMAPSSQTTVHSRLEAILWSLRPRWTRHSTAWVATIAPGRAAPPPRGGSERIQFCLYLSLQCPLPPAHNMPVYACLHHARPVACSAIAPPGPPTQPSHDSSHSRICISCAAVARQAIGGGHWIGLDWRRATAVHWAAAAAWRERFREGT